MPCTEAPAPFGADEQGGPERETAARRCSDPSLLPQRVGKLRHPRRGRMEPGEQEVRDMLLLRSLELKRPAHLVEEAVADRRYRTVPRVGRGVRGDKAEGRRLLPLWLRGLVGQEANKLLDGEVTILLLRFARRRFPLFLKVKNGEVEKPAPNLVDRGLQSGLSAHPLKLQTIIILHVRVMLRHAEALFS